MIKLLATLCIILLCSCGGVQQQMVNLPHSSHAWQIKVGTEAPDAKRVSQAIIIFYRQWYHTFGDRQNKIKKNLDEIMIQWSSKKKVLANIGHNIKGEKINRGVVKGMALTPTYLWLRTNEYKRVFASSLVHELVHVALWSQGCRAGDPDHEGGKYQCWTKQHTNFIQHLNELLFKFDL